MNLTKYKTAIIIIFAFSSGLVSTACISGFSYDFGAALLEYDDCMDRSEHETIVGEQQSQVRQWARRSCEHDLDTAIGTADKAYARCMALR